jgi:hypothetical protein
MIEYLTDRGKKLILEEYLTKELVITSKDMGFKYTDLPWEIVNVDINLCIDPKPTNRMTSIRVVYKNDCYNEDGSIEARYSSQTFHLGKLNDDIICTTVSTGGHQVADRITEVLKIFKREKQLNKLV